MILSTWKPKTKFVNKKQIVIYYTLCDIDNIYEAGSSNIRVLYKCDCETCKNPNRIYAINRNHLTEKRSKTVNEKIQICRSCQTTGDKNPRYGDSRKWEDIFGKEKSKYLKKIFSEKFKGEKNPSKFDDIKKKKNQIIINFENVHNYVRKCGYSLKEISGDNKFADIILKCSKGHSFKIKWCNLPKNKQCKYCYYESIRIPFEKIEEFNEYSKKVRYLTRSNYLRYKKIISGYELKEVDSKNYHIDHIYSISDGFLNKIDPGIISSYFNLRVIKKSDNLMKGRKSEISLDNLLEKYNYFLNPLISKIPFLSPLFSSVSNFVSKKLSFSPTTLVSGDIVAKGPNSPLLNIPPSISPLRYPFMK